MATAATPTQPTVVNPLRRAKYVNVKELVLSHYDVNRQRLDYELAKLKASNDSENVESGDAYKQGGCDTHIEDAALSGAKPYTWAASNLSDLRSGPFRVPIPGKYHQSSLQPPRDGFNLLVDKRRVDGSRVLVAEVEVGDDSGSISLRARDDQIDLLRQISDNHGAVVLRNCTMELYLGKHLRLGVNKWGKLSVYPVSVKGPSLG
ncbi:hypothetical protein ACHAW5_003962 [Stephanodiscus triporus]|uniref:Single-stranded DNA binding protein Ssb-like OB fold domain-containing protein n=1 Tax=Stephanodiscus triporus TaxID=2934178 RepID=A0ABD3NSD3_9STRA